MVERQEQADDTATGGAPRERSFAEPAHLGLRAGARPVSRLRARSGRRTVTGRFPTAKGTRPTLRFHSTLEADGLALLEANPDVALMACHPHVLVWHEPQPGGGTIRRRYTPDAAVRMRDGRVVVLDWKAEAFAGDPAWRAKEPLIKEAYRLDHGVTFRVATERSLRIEPRRTNVRLLLLHRRVMPDPEAQATVAAVIGAIGLPSTVGAICRACRLRHQGHDRAFAELVDLALKGEVRLDMGAPLGSDTIVLPARPRGDLA